jgi:N-succinyldiaminopimelate aminotransferase
MLAQIQRMTQLINYGGVAYPGRSSCGVHGAVADEVHVEAGAPATRHFDAAERILGQRFEHPAGRRIFLVARCGRRRRGRERYGRRRPCAVLPGAYMARADDSGQNPGQRYIRVALVHDPATTAAALQRLADVLMPLADISERTSSSPQARVGA